MEMSCEGKTQKKILRLLSEYQEQGCVVAPTGRGSDFVAACPNRRLALVEVKQGCGSLSKLQNETRDRALASGFDYKVERCNCPKRKK
jgi:hypothetical protein